MHSNPAFRRQSAARSIKAARDHGMGILSINGAAGPLASHLPFLLSEDGQRVEMHLTRSNAILRDLSAPKPALLAVTVAASYVSPDWYGAEDQVPTLNYIAIHLRGSLSRLPDATLRGHIDALSAHFEGQYDKVPWTSDKMSDGVMERMMKAIAPVVLDVGSVDATWKLNQNKPDEQRLSAAGAVSDPVISSAMRGLDD